MDENENKIVIQTEAERDELLLRKGCKYAIVYTNCKSCGTQMRSTPKALLKGFLCRRCKISNTKKNASKEQKLEIQEKRKRTCIDKYGVDNVFKAEEIKAKSKETLQQLYEVTNARHLQLKSDYVKKADRTESAPEDTLVSTENLQDLKITKWDKRTDSQREEILEKRKATNLQKYGTEFAQQSEVVQSKYKANSLQKWGYPSPSNHPSIRAKVENTFKLKYGTKHPSKCYVYSNQVFDSSWELALWIYAEDHNITIEREPMCIPYTFDNVQHYYYPDFKYDNRLLELKGPQFFEDGKMINPFNRSLDTLMEAKHQCGLQNGVEFWSTKEILPILEYVNNKYTQDYIYLFLRTLPFPYPKMRNNSDLELIRFFHKSIYKAGRKGKLSPLQAWQNKDLIKKSALNRLKYVQNCTPEAVLQGFNVAKIAPKVSVFKPTLAERLIKTYLSEASVIVDPFSGFSGRMLGAYNCGKQYVGFDINAEHVEESNEIISYKGIHGTCSVQVQDLISFEGKNWSEVVNTYLFTCPPYGGKEHWNENNDEVEKSCDEWIDLCLEKHKGCKKYLFVVDQTEKYKDKIVEVINNKSHFGCNSEYVVLI